MEDLDLVKWELEWSNLGTGARMKELPIRAWRVIPVQGGVMVFVDPRFETVVIGEGADPKMSKKHGGWVAAENVEAGLQLDMLEAFNAELEIRKGEYGKGRVHNREDD